MLHGCAVASIGVATLITTLPGAPEITVDGRYLDPEQTPLSIEVVATPTPGAYDIQLAR
jgi:hypothetical protein